MYYYIGIFERTSKKIIDIYPEPFVDRHRAETVIMSLRRDFPLPKKELIYLIRPLYPKQFYRDRWGGIQLLPG